MRARTLRARLTLVYGGLFLAGSLALLGVTYVLFHQQLDQFFAGGTPRPGRDVLIKTRDGDTLTGKAAIRWMEEQQAGLRDAATTSLLTQGAIALALVAGLATGAGWLVAGRALAPLHRVTETARRIAAAPDADRVLHERIALPGPPDDVKNLADAFDTMVTRLDRSFDGQRRFVANASHELRTPLTLTRALIEMALHRKGASADLRRLAEDLLQVNARHERVIAGLLTLARSEREVADRSPVDLADLVAHVVAQTADEAARAGVAVHEDAGPAPSRGDALLLERLVHNLVENGVRHNAAGGWVRVRSRTAGGGRVEVEVSNTGPEVPGHEVPGLFEPFRRYGADRVVTAPSAGLGLSIARSITRAHGGDLRARPREGGGLVVTASLPHADDPG
ncbi:sensor histidine kinase [Bailinhaonella thermotolerans]|uniref:histidine kinase n=1 Tax=Bailinhaonella thermotolerans TaxID=1070861 RepID=A0A3A4AZI2_9ACTN|nr:HAMP domain-containing sensor histidine kinase [Bailinhaonella thermotolerans]RJL31253.1 sensor histidine kinase [Bailinhaonella thermotolerans]